MPSKPEVDTRPTFTVDGMLGHVARWLRIMGYDAIYLADADDAEMLRSSANRILLTSDEELYRRALQQGIEAHLVSGDTLLEKLRSVVRRYDLRPDMSGSRCTACNGILKVASPEDIPSGGHVVPHGDNEVWTCTSCGKFYWRGSHWKNIVQTLREIGSAST